MSNNQHIDACMGQYKGQLSLVIVGNHPPMNYINLTGKPAFRVISQLVFSHQHAIFTVSMKFYPGKTKNRSRACQQRYLHQLHVRIVSEIGNSSAVCVRVARAL